MKSKYRFGIPEIISIVVGTIILLTIALISSKMQWEYGEEIALTVVILSSVLFGSYSGCALSFVSSFLYMMIYGQDVGLEIFIMFLMVSLLFGHYAPYFGVRDGEFSVKNILEFVVLNVMVDIFLWLFFAPLIDLIFYGEELFSQIDIGLKRVLFLIILDVILVVILVVIGEIFKKRINGKLSYTKG